MNQHNSQNRIIVGAVIVVLGILALIDNMQVFTSLHVFSFWPTVFIIIGLVKLLQAKHRNGYVYGAVFLGLGLFMTLEHLGLFYFRVHDLWPLILIGAGILVLSRNKVEGDIRRRIDNLHNAQNTQNTNTQYTINPENPIPLPHFEPRATSPTHINLAAVLSGNTRKSDAADFRGGDLTALMGGVELDLTQASILTEAKLNVFAMWGGIVIRVPQDWTVISDVIPILGGADDRTICPPIATKRLIIIGQVIMGGLEIKN
jgi:predicted membrane protein